MTEKTSFDPSLILDIIAEIASEQVDKITKCSDYDDICIYNGCNSLDDNFDCTIDFKNDKNGKIITLKLIDNFSTGISSDDKLSYLNNLSRFDLELEPVANQEYTFNVLDKNFK